MTENEVRMKTKKCGKCKRTKPVTSFHKNKKMGDGLQYRCKPCTLRAQKVSRQNRGKPKVVTTKSSNGGEQGFMLGLMGTSPVLSGVATTLDKLSMAEKKVAIIYLTAQLGE